VPLYVRCIVTKYRNDKKKKKRIINNPKYIPLLPHCCKSLICVQKFNFDQTLILDQFEFCRPNCQIFKIICQIGFLKIKLTILPVFPEVEFLNKNGGLKQCVFEKSPTLHQNQIIDKNSKRKSYKAE